jgi:hypothetical protein
MIRVPRLSDGRGTRTIILRQFSLPNMDTAFTTPPDPCGVPAKQPQPQPQPPRIPVTFLATSPEYHINVKGEDLRVIHDLQGRIVSFYLRLPLENRGVYGQCLLFETAISPLLCLVVDD